MDDFFDDSYDDGRFKLNRDGLNSPGTNWSPGTSQIDWGFQHD